MGAYLAKTIFVELVVRLGIITCKLFYEKSGIVFCLKRFQNSVKAKQNYYELLK